MMSSLLLGSGLGNIHSGPGFLAAGLGPGLGFLAAGLGAGLVIIGAAYGIGKLAAAALDGTARQPEAAGDLRTSMIIPAALIEGIAFFALIICFLMGDNVLKHSKDELEASKPKPPINGPEVPGQ